MFKQTFFLTILLSIFCTNSVKGAVIDSNWVGGCCARYWSDANNWNPNIVPDNGGGNTFVVTINANTNYIDVILEQDRTIDRIDCYSSGEYDIDLGGNNVELTFASPNGLTNHGNLTIADLANVDVFIIGNVRNYGSLAFDGEVGVDGNLQNFENGELAILKGETSVESGRLENLGLLVIPSPGKLLADPCLANIGQVRMNGGLCDVGILDNNSTATISGYGTFYTSDLIRNEGEIYAAGGSLVIVSEGSLTNTGILGNKPMASLNIMHVGLPKDINNLGKIEVNAGGGVIFDCNLINEPNGIIQLKGGTLAATTITQTADANFAGFGGITGDIVIDPNGIIKLAGPTNIVGDVNISANATLEISDGVTLVTGHTTNNGTIHMKGGRIIPQGGITNNGNVIWETGTYNNVADFNLDGQVNFKDFASFAETWLWQADLN